MIAQLDAQYIRTRPTKSLPRLLSHLFFQGRFLTTGHRWLNKPIALNLAVLKSIPELRAVREPIFIVGTGRSGSTILGKVLSMHREIGFLNEPKAMWYAIDRKEDINGHFSRASAQYRFSAEDATPGVIRSAHHLFGNYLAFTGSQRVLDKNPEIIFRVPYVKTIFPDAKFIFLVRNGYDTSASIVKWSQQHGLIVNGNQEDWWGLDNRKWRIMLKELVKPNLLFADIFTTITDFQDHYDMAVTEWIVTMQEGLRQLEQEPTSMIMLRYEDLISDPGRKLPEILQFCHLPDDQVFLDYAVQALNTGSAYAKRDVHPVLVPAFEETMTRLGY